MADIATILLGSAFRVKLSQKDSDADIMVMDVTTSETTNLEAEVTDHPVEDGPDINDHVRPKPVTVDLECLISETPLTLAKDLAGLKTNTAASLTSIARGFGGGVVSQVASKLGNQFGSIAGGAAGLASASLLQNDSNVAKVARNMLEQMLVNKVIFKLNTKMKIYDNMVITKLVFPRTNETGKALKFTMSCKQLNIVKSVTVAPIARSAAGGANKKANLGKQPPKPAAPETYSSMLKRGGDAIGGTLKGFFQGSGSSAATSPTGLSLN